MKQIAIYLRLSLADSDLGEDGKEESNSIENQRLLIRNYLQSNEELLGEVIEYKDDGYSGLNFNRPGFRQMIEDCKTGKIGTIIVKDLSRFGRDYIGVGDYLEQILPSLEIRLIAINSRYDSQEHGANILSLDVSISNMINNMYSKDLSKKLKSSFYAKWNEGQNPSSLISFGYKVVKVDGVNTIEIDEEAAETVRNIFDLANHGKSSKMIAEILNEKGLPTPLIYRIQKGERTIPKGVGNVEEQLWNTHNVLNIIKNYDYTGARVHRKYEKVCISGTETKKTQKADQVVVENNHPAIISKEKYYNAQLIIKKTRAPKNWNKRGDAFKKKLKCGCCGLSLQFLNDEKQLYCQHSESIGSKSKCNKNIYDRGIIIASVISAIRKNIEELSDLKEKLTVHSDFKYSEYESEICKRQKELKELSDDLARQYENYVNGHLERKQFICMKREIIDKRNAIENDLKEAEEKKNASDNVLFDINRTLNMGQAFFSKDKIQDEIIDVFLKDVYVYSQDRIEIRLKTNDLYENALSELNEAK